MSSSRSRLRELGWTAAVLDRFADLRAAHQPARVSGVDDAGADLVGGSGAIRASHGGALLRAAAADTAAWPVVGDWAAVRDWPDGRVTLEAVLPRATTLVDAAGRLVAANVDAVVVTDGVEKLRGQVGVGRTVALTGPDDDVHAALREVLRGRPGPQDGDVAAVALLRHVGEERRAEPVGGAELVVVPGCGVVIALPGLGAGWSLLDAARQRPA
ncbi:hypothetical protein [Jiangella asiatica]|uniref:Uncharacterized protein n=1 Tax=Jiangella asiatica TaxID=2530372 RepID=A0A4R5D701_9ACTN|nr:hypothetical protein [Jiangella asiatica]TDE09259.1 hypothetical protein E1269_14635 [Jiangella asiatica]